RLHAAARSIGNPVAGLHPELLEDMVNDLDLREVLYPIGGVPARHHEAGWVAIQHGERLAVHLIGHDDVRVLHDPRDVEALDEVWNRGEGGLVQPVKRNLYGALPHAHHGEDVPHPSTDPLGVAHGAVAPLPTQHSRGEAAAAVARA